MKNIGYVIKLSGKPNRYAYGRVLSSSRVFRTRDDARKDKREFARKVDYCKPQEIWQVSLSKTGRAKARIKKVS